MINIPKPPITLVRSKSDIDLPFFILQSSGFDRTYAMFRFLKLQEQIYKTAVHIYQFGHLQDKKTPWGHQISVCWAIQEKLILKFRK